MRRVFALITLAVTPLVAPAATAQQDEPNAVAVTVPDLPQNDAVVFMADLRERLRAREAAALPRIARGELPEELRGWFAAQRAELERAMLSASGDGVFTAAEQQRLDGIVVATAPLRLEGESHPEVRREAQERALEPVMDEARERARAREQADMEQLREMQRRIRAREAEWQRLQQREGR